MVRHTQMVDAEAEDHQLAGSVCTIRCVSGDRDLQLLKQSTALIFLAGQAEAGDVLVSVQI